jgi:hypothetical protein
VDTYILASGTYILTGYSSKERGDLQSIFIVHLFICNKFATKHRQKRTKKDKKGQEIGPIFDPFSFPYCSKCLKITDYLQVGVSRLELPTPRPPDVPIVL